MKRLLAINCILGVLAISSVKVFGAEIKPQDIVFHPAGGGCFLYNNNPEGIDDMAVVSGENMRYISSYEGLTPDIYYLYMSYFNYTGGGKRGYDIEVDTGVTALEDTVITIRNASFSTVRTGAYIEGDKTYKYMNDWEFVDVCADMLGVPITDMRGKYLYEPSEYKPVTIEIKKGETFWLSSCMDGYKQVHFGDPVHYQAIMEIESGLADINTLAVPYSGSLGDRSTLPENIEFGIYRYDYTVKGIVDTLPHVISDTIHYTIDDTTQTGSVLPGTVYNQYAPEGNTVDCWCSNINPVSDYWSKYTAVESDMIKLEYKDKNKLNYYGKNASEKDDVWRFDTRHAASSKYESTYGVEPDDYVPNFEIEDIFKKGIENYACNLGNYGVTETYVLEIENRGSKDRYFEYDVMTKSNVIVFTTDEKGNFDRAYSKGMSEEAVFTPMAAVKLPAGKTTKFCVNMFIPVNVNGGIQNRFTIEDENNVRIVEYVPKTEANPLRGKSLEDVKDKLGKTAVEELGNNLDSYEINDGDGVHLVRWCAWDGNPYYYGNLWGHCNTVYVLDDNYEITNKYTLPSMPNESDIVEGVMYVRDTVNGIFSSYDNGDTWTLSEITEIPQEYPLKDKTFSDWAENIIDKAFKYGIVPMYMRTDFNDFTVPLSRIQFCDLMYEMLDRMGKTPSKSDRVFTDCYDEHMLSLAGAGIINGVSETEFNPNGAITREQAATVLARCAKYLGIKTDSSAVYISDVVSDWAIDSVYIMYNFGIMRGIGDNKFDAYGIYTLEQSLAAQTRLYEYAVSAADFK